VAQGEDDDNHHREPAAGSDASCAGKVVLVNLK